ncbi:unnamed protein product, partial [Mesorhabditis spiculigera]
MTIDPRYSRTRNVDHDGIDRVVNPAFKIAYGTAGFRDRAETLPFVMFRVGFLAALRAKKFNKTVGVMITASHNPACDNGVKIVDPLGEMMEVAWEVYATDLANTSDEALLAKMEELKALAPSERQEKAAVVCAVDTRPSGIHLASCVASGVSLLDVDYEFLDQLTTPQLHYAVRVANDPDYGPAGPGGYERRFKEAYYQLKELIPKAKPSILKLDCANGMGAPKARELFAAINDPDLSVEFLNEKGELNHECGADFVKISKLLPRAFGDVAPDVRCASLDGDADRLIYFRASDSQRLDASEIGVTLLDGDKIATLFSRFLIEQLREAGLFGQLTVGVVQTAYANGASTAYIRDVLGVTPVFVPTGVKHLHHEAVKYDIGVYFEANGHGTVCFSDKFKETVKERKDENVATARLRYFSRVVNEIVGDALADLLAVELLLMYYGWNVVDWDQDLYKDAPNVQKKVPVLDRSIYSTTWDETRLLTPIALQNTIDATVKEHGAIRAFVRPSGTENIVRVYVEAHTAEVAEKIASVLASFITGQSPR